MLRQHDSCGLKGVATTVRKVAGRVMVMFDLLYLTIVAMICIGEVGWLRVSSLLTSRYVAVCWWGWTCV